MIKKGILYFFLTFVLHSITTAQEIEINEPSSVRNMIEVWEKSNFATPYVSGWRVQIASTNDLREAEKIKQKFESEYYEIPIDWVQDYPYYKVRVGAFLEKKDTKILIERLRKQYPGSYAAKDTKIPVTDFIPSY